MGAEGGSGEGGDGLLAVVGGVSGFPVAEAEGDEEGEDPGYSGEEGVGVGFFDVCWLIFDMLVFSMVGGMVLLRLTEPDKCLSRVVADEEHEAPLHEVDGDDV